MLKFQINTRSVVEAKKPLEIVSATIDELYGEESTGKQLLICTCAKPIDFKEKQRLIAIKYISVDNNDDFTGQESSVSEEYNIEGINLIDNTFSVVIDKYYHFNVMSAVKNSDGDYTLYLNSEHFFGVDDTITFYAEYFDGTDYVINTISADYESKTAFRVSSFGSELDNIMFNGDSEFANLNNIYFYRDQFLFNATEEEDTDSKEGRAVGAGFKIYLDRTFATLPIPMSAHFATDLQQADNIRDKFTLAETDKAINRIVEMEKDVYHPVIYSSKDKKIKDEVYKIKFNLHFREHRGDDWLAPADSYWNGTRVVSGKLSLMEDITGGSTPFFSYKGTDKNRSCQSDLLTYLGFSNNDVKFQKNKLKKSFIRLMFYDSTNPANQNMLAYSTIFMNSGELFSKYARYIEDYPYTMLTYTDTGVKVTKNLSGIRVDRETAKTDITDIDELEGHRLSSQFIVEDKYSSDGSSEGFYLYLWKDNDGGVVPTDIYMKVEFNHAGYGRTIPFMMPFWDKKKYASKPNGRIKTFKEIVGDWNNDTGSDGEYGIKQYLKYAYIHFKYQYDKATNRHIYYLDDEEYGEKSVHFDDNAITLNLYEAKIS